MPRAIQPRATAASDSSKAKRTPKAAARTVRPDQPSRGAPAEEESRAAMR